MTDDVIDPEVAAALAAAPVASLDLDWTSIGLSGIPALRETVASLPVPELPPTSAVHQDHFAPGPDEGAEVAVRVYRPGGASDQLPCIYWIHGGGYMFGSGLLPDPRVHRWVEQLGCVVASVDYRLAPEHPYPAPLDDCYAGLVWAVAHADVLGIDAERIVIAGGSAGGGLAAGLALLARDRGEVAPCHQLLIYPMIDDRNLTPSSHLDTVIWTREANLLGWEAYLGHPPGGDDVPVYAAAARADNVAGLPAAFIGVGTRDVFRDEDIDYARRLLEAGVPVELHVYPGAPHGFEVFAPLAAVSRQLEADIDRALARALRSQLEPAPTR